MKKQLLTICAATYICSAVFSQTFQWGLKCGSNPTWKTSDVTTNGSTFLYGSAKYEMALDTISFTGASYYFAGVNNSGRIQFLKKATELINQIAGDKDDNCFVTFNTSNSATLPIFVGTDTIKKETTKSQILFAKYDKSGKQLWNFQYNPVDPAEGVQHSFNTPYDKKSSIITDASGNVIILVDLNGYNVKIKVDTATVIGNNKYIFKFNSAGKMIYYKNISGCNPYEITTDKDGNLLLAGTITGVANSAYNKMDFGNGVVLNYTTLKSNQFEFFVTKFNASGVTQWAKNTTSFFSTTAVNNVLPTITDLVTDKSNASYLVGYFNTKCIFYTDTLSGISTNYTRNAFISKFKVDGTFQWAKTYTDTSSVLEGTEIKQLRFGSNNDMYLFCNYIRKGFSFFGNAMPKNGSSGSSDRMLARLDSTMTLKWWKYIVGGETNNIISKMNVTNNDDLVLTSGGTASISTLTFLYNAYWMPVEDIVSKGKIYGNPYIVKFSSDIIGGITEQNVNQNAEIYPNPASDIIYLKTPNSNLCNVEIMNINGQVVSKSGNLNIEKGIKINNLNSGIYFVRLTNDKKMTVYKFIKQ